jgi:hypothetical protein
MHIYISCGRFIEVILCLNKSATEVIELAGEQHSRGIKMVRRVMLVLLATLLLASAVVYATNFDLFSNSLKGKELQFGPPDPKPGDYIQFRDSKVHDIDTDLGKPARVDYIAPGQKTTVNLMDGGLVSFHFEVYQDGIVNILGGMCVNLYAWDDATINLSGGLVGNGAVIRDNCKFTMTGGEVSSYLDFEDKTAGTISGGRLASVGASDNTRLTISGSRFRFLSASDTAVVKITGSDFAIDGVPITNAKLKFEKKYDKEDRRLTGVLESKDKINATIRILGDAVVVIETVKPVEKK